METLPDLRPASTSHVLGPHSLGQSVEWKQHRKNLVFLLRESFHGPTRWGNQLNGNRWRFLCQKRSGCEGPTRWGNQLNGNVFNSCLVVMVCTPKGPTRWGNQLNGNTVSLDKSPCHNIVVGPTRWGNQLNGNKELSPSCSMSIRGPTRWGNQLNGNQVEEALLKCLYPDRPHSLGQSVEWKRNYSSSNCSCTR